MSTEPDYYTDKFRKLIRKTIKKWLAKYPGLMTVELAQPLDTAMKDAGVEGPHVFLWQQLVWKEMQLLARKRSKIKTKLVTNRDGSKVRLVVDKRQAELKL